MRRTDCKECGNKLSDTSAYTGLCVLHAGKRYKSTVRALKICAIVGAVLAVAFFEVVTIMQRRSDGTYYGTEFGFRIYAYFVTMSAVKLNTIGLVLFFIPFGVGLDAAFLPDLYISNYIRPGGFEGNAGVALIKWVLCTILAPVVITFTFFYIIKLKRYINEAKEST